ncbi:hypothetical protein Taro_039276 [Colocasia esculenta]|uniref:Uncharacterized protein n=1 Tax=Colocasia esculenta TaxID=4460 RepID=A0A843W8W9_COLES|nr:hypothetical protein [Colocasia esculenta]
MTRVWLSSAILWHLGDVLEREWPSRRFARRLETLHHLSRHSLCHRTHTVVLFRHRRHLFLSIVCAVYIKVGDNRCCR